MLSIGESARHIFGGKSQVSRASLKAKVLCVAHNSLLSELDDETIVLYKALRTHALALSPGEARVQVNGPKIERWCMKCAYSLLAAGWHGRDRRGFLPDPAMVQMIFGQVRLPAPAGLYVVKKPEIKLRDAASTVGWNVISRDPPMQHQIVAHYIQLMALLLIVSGGDITPLLRQVKDSDLDWSTAELTYRPREIFIRMRHASWRPDEVNRLAIEFGW